MQTDTELLKIVPRLPHVRLDTRLCCAVRYAFLTDPSCQVLCPHATVEKGQRFTAPGGAPAIYLAFDMMTALAEVEAVTPSDHGMPATCACEPYVVAPIEATLERVLDLTNPNIQAALGTHDAELRSPWQNVTGSRTGELPPTQRLGWAAYASQGTLAIRYASAKVRGGECLVIFHERLTASRDAYVQVLDEGRLRQRIPECVARGCDELNARNNAASSPTVDC